MAVPGVFWDSGFFQGLDVNRNGVGWGGVGLTSFGQIQTHFTCWFDGRD